MNVKDTLWWAVWGPTCSLSLLCGHLMARAGFTIWDMLPYSLLIPSVGVLWYAFLLSRLPR